MKKANVLFYLSIICAIWFVFTSWAWIYFINLFISLPIGIAAFFLARAGNKVEGNSKRFRAINLILFVGVIIAIVVLIGYLLTN